MKESKPKDDKNNTIPKMKRISGQTLLQQPIMIEVILADLSNTR